MSDCLFCRIITKQIPAAIVYESPTLLAFDDIHPQATTHVLIIPKEHISTLNDAKAQHKELLGDLVLAAQEIAKKRGHGDDGYRVVMNCNRDGGQTVFHIHLHLLAGRHFSWPPG